MIEINLREKKMSITQHKYDKFFSHKYLNDLIIHITPSNKQGQVSAIWPINKAYYLTTT